MLVSLLDETRGGEKKEGGKRKTRHEKISNKPNATVPLTSGQSYLSKRNLLKEKEKKGKRGKKKGGGGKNSAEKDRHVRFCFLQK